MKHILTTLCVLVLIIACVIACIAVLTAEASSDVSYSPAYVETYTYGDFDEPGTSKVYRLSPSDDLSLIPTEDFDHNGRRYLLMKLIREDDAEAGSGTVTYTAVFGSEKLPGRAKSSDFLFNREICSNPLWQKSMQVVVVVLLILLACEIFESRRPVYPTDEADSE